MLDILSCENEERKKYNEERKSLPNKLGAIKIEIGED